MIEKLMLAFRKLRNDVRDLDRRIDALPQPKDGRDGVSPSAEEIADLVLAQIPQPKDGRDGISPSAEEIADLVLAQMPQPKDGRDGVSPSAEEIADLVLAQIPQPKDGRDGISPSAEEIADLVLAQMPQPKDGRDGISPSAQEIAAQVPQPKDGDSITDVKLEKNTLFVWIAGKKKRVGKIEIPQTQMPSFSSGGGVRRDWYSKQVVVKKPVQLSGNLRSDVVYYLDGIIDFTGTGIQIVVPAGGLNLAGHTFDVSGLKCTDDNYTMFVSADGGSGNVLGVDYSVEVSGSNSQVYDLVDATGFNAFEFQRINYNNCTSLGSIKNYRQGLEDGTGRFGGTPELTLVGSWVGGYRVSTSIARSMSDMSALFKAGPDFVFSGRFLIDLNVDLPTQGALFDFSEVNVANDLSLLVLGSTVTRNGVSDSSDISVHPNIDQNSVKSNWRSNTGISNTVEYLKASIITEVTTSIPLVETYYPLAGTFTVSISAHIAMPANGEFELLTGDGLFLFSGNISLEGTANDVIDVRAVKSGDGGASWPTQIEHFRRVVNNLTGSRDVAFFPVSFITPLKKGDRVRFEVENKTAGRDVTMELDSYITISES